MASLFCERHDRFWTGFRGAADFGPMKISGMMNGGPEVTLIIGVTSVARRGEKKSEWDDRLLAGVDIDE